ncbi:hypothetical protein [Acidovorax sp. A1169]|uniref:hypothetical protein n=1 Tax=Acidovorax sp. A1169 TaxID=3059524 RepID=UPI0035227610
MAERKQVDDKCMAVDRRGRPAALTPEHIVLLRGSVSRMPHATPARYERRHLVDACCYVLRTGCAW